MKVLRVVTTMNPKAGGVVEAIHQVAKELNRSGWQMDVLCFDDIDAQWIINSDFYKVYAIGKGLSAYSFKLNYLPWLYKHCREYDLVIIDGLWQFHMVGGYLLKLLKIPYCVYTHGMLDPYFNKDKLKYFKKLPFWFLIERNVISMAAGVLFTCEEELLLAENTFPFYRSSPHIASLGIAEIKDEPCYLKNIFYKKFPDLKTKSFALFLSRIDPKKGIDMLIEALGRMKNIPDDFYLVIVGPGSEQLKCTLIEMSAKFGVKGLIVWAGMLQGAEKWGAFHAAEVFILPSHQENFGIVVAEALSTSTPVLITDKVNIWREIEAEDAGLVEKDSVAGVAKLLTKWLNYSTEDKKEFGVKAKKCYQNNFSLDAAIESFQTVLSNVKNK